MGTISKAIWTVCGFVATMAAAYMLSGSGVRVEDAGRYEAKRVEVREVVEVVRVPAPVAVAPAPRAIVDRHDELGQEFVRAYGSYKVERMVTLAREIEVNAKRFGTHDRHLTWTIIADELEAAWKQLNGPANYDLPDPNRAFHHYGQWGCGAILNPTQK